MSKKKFLLFFLIMSWFLPTFAAEPIDIPLPIERIFWDRTPIRVTLRVGYERIVQFRDTKSVQVGVPGKLQRGLLRTQVVDNTVYWLAQDAFKSERIQIVNASTGESFLFDLEAKKEEGGTTPIEVVSALGKEKAAVPFKERERGYIPMPSGQGSAYDYVSLTRFAAQAMYAPLRLQNSLPGMVAIPIEPDKKVPLVRGGKVEAMPLMIWKAPGLYISAIRLKNMTSGYVTLDPRELRGDWLTATFQHVRLMPVGDEADTTCVYLISRQQPFF